MAGPAHTTYDELLLPIHGEHAARNAAAAIAAAEALIERELDADAVRAALASVTSPGRLEVVGRRPLIILDGAHNPTAAEALATALPETFAGDRLHLVMAVFKDKDLDGIVRAIAPLADAGYATAVESVRARPAEEIAAALIAAGVPAESFGTVGEALEAARDAATQDDIILVTGSLYTVADARRVLVGGSGA